MRAADSVTPIDATHLTPREVADALRVSMATLVRFRRKRMGPPFVKIGARFWYPKDGVEALTRPARA